MWLHRVELKKRERVRKGGKESERERERGGGFALIAFATLAFKCLTHGKHR